MSFGGVKAPTLLMWGEEDEWTPLSQSERWMAELRNVKLITYPGVGHMPMEEIPFQSVSDAITFLGGCTWRWRSRGRDLPFDREDQ